ncbi:hypothetical protein ACFQ0T_34290 [Kitasatospora gansuensis]
MLRRSASILSAALAAVVALTTLTACGSGDSQGAADDKAPLEIWVRKPRAPTPRRPTSNWPPSSPS